MVFICSHLGKSVYAPKRQVRFHHLTKAYLPPNFSQVHAHKKQVFSILAQCNNRNGYIILAFLRRLCEITNKPSQSFGVRFLSLLKQRN